jgi:hypothetical protein
VHSIEIGKSVADYIQKEGCPDIQPHSIDQTPRSFLFLRVQAAAEFYTTNKTLMNNPPPVLIDLILDPYLANILPASLVTTAAYITFLAIVSIPLSRTIYQFITTTSL